MNRFKTHWSWLLSGSATLLLAYAIFLYISPALTWTDWTGFGEDTNKTVEETFQNGKLTHTKRITHFQSGKNLWDWLGLAGVIAIPVVLFQFQQQQQKKSEEQAEFEKEIASTNLREEALRDYIDKIAELLIDKELKVLLKQLSEDAITKDDPKLDAALDVARARTLSILRRLDGDGKRKSSVVHFLIDAKLIQGLDLLKDANLSRVYLLGANLTGANLYGADLTVADLSVANLTLANLNYASLDGTCFSGAVLTGADLIGAYLIGAYLIGANLIGANLIGANLTGADLSESDLSRAKLSGANLSEANLKGVKNLTPEQIKDAQSWEKADYDPDFREQLGLPPESSSE